MRGPCISVEAVTEGVAPGRVLVEDHGVVLGLDERIAAFGDGASIWVVAAISVLLGLRHATDPDHLLAVTSLAASGRERAGRGAARLGLTWGAGHGLTLCAVGIPVVVLHGLVPRPVEQGAEAAVALAIVALGVRLLRRWCRGRAGGAGRASGRAGRRHHPPRTGREAFGVGLLHGLAGSAGIGVLLLAGIDSTRLAILALLLLAASAAVSMTAFSCGLGALASRARLPLRGFLVPALGVVGTAFGIWYGLGALGLAPHLL